MDTKNPTNTIITTSASLAVEYITMYSSQTLYDFATNLRVWISVRLQWNNGEQDVLFRLVRNDSHH
jgi:hypothetical protein